MRERVWGLGRPCTVVGPVAAGPALLLAVGRTEVKNPAEVPRIFAQHPAPVFLSRNANQEFGAQFSKVSNFGDHNQINSFDRNES